MPLMVMTSKSSTIREKRNYHEIGSEQVGVCRAYYFAEVRPSGIVHGLYECIYEWIASNELSYAIMKCFGQFFGPQPFD